MRRLAEEVIEQTAIEIFLSDSPGDVRWDQITEEERAAYRKRAIDQLTRKLVR